MYVHQTVNECWQRDVPGTTLASIEMLPQTTCTICMVRTEIIKYLLQNKESNHVWRFPKTEIILNGNFHKNRAV